MVCDGQGNLYLSRHYSGAVDVYGVSGTYKERFIGDLSWPNGLALDKQGHLCVVDSGPGVVRKYDLEGNVVDASLITGLTTPNGIAFDGEDKLYVCDGGTQAWDRSRVAVYTTSGVLVNADFAPGVFSPMAVVVIPAESRNGAFVSISPAPNERDVPTGHIRVEHRDGAASWHSDNLTLRVDGVRVVPTVERSGRTVVVTFDPAPRFAPWSRHTVELGYPSADGPQSLVWSFLTKRETRDSVAHRLGELRRESEITLTEGGRPGIAGASVANFPAEGGGGMQVVDADFLGGLAAQDEFSVSLWMKSHQLSYASLFWAGSPSLDVGIELATDGRDQSLWFYTGGNYGAETALPTPASSFPGYSGGRDWWEREWHHFVFTKAKDKKQVWIDGVAVGQGTGAVPIPKDLADFSLGSRTSGAYPLLIASVSLCAGSVVAGGAPWLDQEAAMTGPALGFASSPEPSIQLSASSLGQRVDLYLLNSGGSVGIGGLDLMIALLGEGGAGPVVREVNLLDGSLFTAASAVVNSDAANSARRQFWSVSINDPVNAPTLIGAGASTKLGFLTFDSPPGAEDSWTLSFLLPQTALVDSFGRNLSLAVLNPNPDPGTPVPEPEATLPIAAALLLGGAVVRRFIGTLNRG